MSQLETRTRTVDAGTERVKVPSVLVVLVAKDGEPWLPQCLSSLSHQSHPRIGILAIDNGSTDRSASILESALGSARVIRMREAPRSMRWE